jgi:uncharacterized membrane protein YhiD involved in acid resistance
MDWNWLEGTELRHLPALVTSLAIGLLIGLERERHAGVKAGLRTFALDCLDLVVGGQPLFRRCAGTMMAVVAGLVVALVVTKPAAL